MDIQETLDEHTKAVIGTKADDTKQSQQVGTNTSTLNASNNQLMFLYILQLLMYGPFVLVLFLD